MLSGGLKGKKRQGEKKKQWWRKVVKEMLVIVALEREVPIWVTWLELF